MILGLGPIGWLVAFAVGFVVGGVFFLSMKAQVDYVVARRGPVWLLPAMLYARMAFVGAVLVVLAVWLEPVQVPAAMLAGLAGALVARILVARMVQKRPNGPPPDEENQQESLIPE